MDQKWILILMILNQKITSRAAVIVKEGQRHEMRCEITDKGSTISWFRAQEKPTMEFLASYNINGEIKAKSNNFLTIFDHTKLKSSILALKAFNKARDSGLYSCASQKGTALIFGRTIRLDGEQVKVTTTAPLKIITTPATPCTTATQCPCNNQEKGDTNLSMDCSPIIFGPLVGGCGLLLLLLIVTTLYCNKIRTRRCPHHHNRKPRPMPPGKQIPNRRM